MIVGMSKSQMEKLVEEELGSVAFVMDYVELDFGNARFSSSVHSAWPDGRLSALAQQFVDFCVGGAAEEGP
jgi:hypothetical protein